MKLAVRWRKWVALQPLERRLLAQALLSVVWARIELSVVPYSRLAKRPRVANRKYADAAVVVWAIRMAARIVPRATCLVQALAAQRLLAAQGHPSALHIGVSKASPKPGNLPDNSEFQAHAWLEQDGEVLLGASDVAYVPLTRWSAAE